MLSSNFCMTQSQSSVIKFSSFIFLPPEVSDSKTRERGTHPLNVFTMGALLLLYSKIAEFWGPSHTLSTACG